MTPQEKEKYLEEFYSSYIHRSRYARWLESENRRETWEETVTRYINFWAERFPVHYGWLNLVAKPAILNLEVMPSMRALMTAGPALDRDEIAGYNCSFVAVDHPRAFDETMYILSCGTGVGFSVERQFINQLPAISEEFYDSGTIIKVHDSRTGWASSFRELISLLYSGQVPQWDTSSVRPAGARLKTFGGRASGPGPLEDLFKFTVRLFKSARGRKLNSVECHDLMCKIADIIVAGGVRRSALISLSNLTDERMRNAKMGQWWEANPQRTLANNSAAYTEKPDIGIFMKEWLSIYESQSGERGIFNRVAASKQAARNGRRITEGQHFGTNPCGEIILRPNGLCNLTEVVVRAGDTFEDLRQKVEIATVLGTFQSTLTHFRYVRSIWRRNAEDERLLGVSLTGIMDNPMLAVQREENGEYDLEGILHALKEEAVETNKRWAELLGIPQSAAITTVKPSGTVSQLVNSASGIHPRYSQYYIRAVRNDVKDPLAQYLISRGVPHEIDKYNPNTYVFYFPIKGPENSVCRNDMTAVEQLNHYLDYKQYWCEHNPSITVYVRPHEWLEVGSWVYENFNDIGGVSFLPHTDHIYEQAPYTECTKEVYEKAVEAFPIVDWNEFFETEDNATATRELSCTAGVCEI